jgi:ribosomal protein S18 acetylase RimI-like enzyme
VQKGASFVIEPARPHDMDEVYALLAEANFHPIPSPEMPRFGHERCFVARLPHDQIGGACGYDMLSPTVGKTTLLAVLPQLRTLGIGRALQLHRMRIMYRLGARRLITNCDDPKTIAWYQRHFGYRDTGKRVRKVHPFGVPEISEWSTLECDLVAYFQSVAQEASAPQ